VQSAVGIIEGQFKMFKGDAPSIAAGLKGIMGSLAIALRIEIRANYELPSWYRIHL
jgi:hypothetical protein